MPVEIKVKGNGLDEENESSEIIEVWSIWTGVVTSQEIAASVKETLNIAHQDKSRKVDVITDISKARKTTEAIQVAYDPISREFLDDPAIRSIIVIAGGIGGMGLKLATGVVAGLTASKIHSFNSSEAAKKYLSKMNSKG